MNRTLHAELTKLLTLRSSWALLAGAAALTALTALGTVANAGDGEAPLEAAEGMRNLLASAGMGGILALVAGALATGGEFRHGTIVRSLLAAPDRRRWLAAKGLASAAAGLVMGLTGVLATLAVVAVVVAGGEETAPLRQADATATLLGSLCAYVVYGVLGAALGALLRSQPGALAAGLGWLVAGEGVLVALVPDVAQWAPGRAVQALIGAGGTFDDTDLLSAPAGGLVLAGYALVIAGTAAVTTLRRDVA